MDTRLSFFRSQLLDLVALAERETVIAPFDTAAEAAQNIDLSLAKFYVDVLNDALTFAKDENVIFRVNAILDTWKLVVAGNTLPIWGNYSFAADAYLASHTGGTLLGGDQKALDLIAARCAARTTGIASDAPEDQRHNDATLDKPENALGNVGLLISLGMSKSPLNPIYAQIQWNGKTDSMAERMRFTRTRALEMSNQCKIYIAKLTALL